MHWLQPFPPETALVVPFREWRTKLAVLHQHSVPVSEHVAMISFQIFARPLSALVLVVTGTGDSGTLSQPQPWTCEELLFLSYRKGQVRKENEGKHHL